jgi:hypothetical protein
LIVLISTYERSTLGNDAKYIGLDVHQATISVAILDSAGKLVMEAILETSATMGKQMKNREIEWRWTTGLEPAASAVTA